MAKDIRVTLKLDNNQYNRNLKASATQTKQFANESKAGFASMKTAFIGLLGAIGTREIISLGDQFTNLNNRLKAVTGDTQLAANALKLVNEVAGQSRSDISSVASLFADLTVATRDLGTSQREIADVTRVFSQTLQISGADAGAAAGAIRQFGQALASGVLRGDEFNSIAETNSFFMLQLADALGQPIGKLRDLAKEGKLTADIILGATKIMKDQVAADFENTAVTVGQAFTQLRNSFVNLFGKVEAETGVSDSLSDAISKLATSIDNIDIGGFVENIDKLVYAAGLLISVFGMRGMLGLLSKVQGAFIAAGGIFASTGKTLTSFNRGVVAAKQALKGLAGVFTLGIGFTGKGGFFGAMGMAVANLGRVLLRFVLGPLGAILTGLELLSFASKKLGGPDFMASARDKIIEFGKDLLGFNEETENAIANLQRFDQVSKDFVGPLLPGQTYKTDPEPDPNKDNTLLKIDLGKSKRELTEIEKFRKKIDDSLPGLKNYQYLLEELGLQFGDASTIKEIEEYKSLMDELKTRFEMDKPFTDFIDSLQGVTLTTEEYNEKQRQLNALIQKFPELAEEAAKAQDELNEKLAEDESFRKFIDNLNKATDTLSDDLATALMEGKSAMDSFKGFFKTLVQQVIADALKLLLIIPILEAIGFSTMGGSITGLSGKGFLGSLGFKQTGIGGGNLMPNRPVLVGEAGPEIFYPASSGSLSPNAMATQVTYNIQAVDAPSFQALVARDPEFIYSVTRAGQRRLPGAR